MSFLLRSGLAVSLAVTVLAAPARAEIPKTIAFQGRLTDSNGRSLDGNQSVTFRLFDAATGGTKLWEETKGLAVSAGLFSTFLGSTTPLALPFDRPYWVEVQVGSEILNPRQPLASSPYALRTHQIEGMSIIDGKVGIGAMEPTVALDVRRRSDAFWTPASNSWKNRTLLSVVSITNTSPGGYDPVFLGQMSTQPSGAARPAFAIGAVGGGPWFDENPRSQTAHLYIAVRDDANRLQERLRIASDGNVGIGTASPQAKLEVNGPVRLTPSGTPANLQAGTIYYDAATQHFFGFDGSAWKQLDN